MKGTRLRRLWYERHSGEGELNFTQFTKEVATKRSDSRIQSGNVQKKNTIDKK